MAWQAHHATRISYWIPASQSVRECRICEERSDEAIFKCQVINEIGALRSQIRRMFLHSRTDCSAGVRQSDNPSQPVLRQVITYV